MRNALALLVLVSIAGSAHAADRERPTEPRPCKCARPRPIVSLELVGKKHDAFSTNVLARMQVQRHAVSRCIGPDAKVAVTFKRDSTKPRFSTSSPGVTACLDRIRWSFDAAPRAATIRVLASTRFSRG
jgi:hypothetical protein